MAGNETLGLVMAAIVMIIAVFVFSSISVVMDNKSVASENLTGTGYGGGYGSGGTLTYAPIEDGSLLVWNGSEALGVSTTDGYTIVLSSGAMNITSPGSTDNVYVNYSYGYLTGQAATTVTTINTTAYAGFALIVISLIIIAAAVILRYTGMLGGGRGT